MGKTIENVKREFMVRGSHFFQRDRSRALTLHWSMRL